MDRVCIFSIIFFARSILQRSLIVRLDWASELEIFNLEGQI